MRYSEKETQERYISFSQNSELKTQNSALRTQNSELRTQHSALSTN
ncbi:hypothetical protein [Anabaena sp. CCY 9402-a]